MRHCMNWLAFLGMCCVPALLPAEDTYTIKLKKSTKGDVSSVTKDEKIVSKLVGKLLGKEDGDTVLDERESSKEHFKFKEEVLGVDEKGHALKLRRQYEKATKTKDDTTDDYFLQGKTVIIEKKSDEKKFSFKIEDGDEIKAEDAAPLEKEFNEKDSEIDEDAILLPAKAVALNETWEITKADELFKEMVDKEENVVLDLKGAKGTGKLTKVYKKAGMQFGVVEYELTVPVTAIGGKDAKFKMNKGTQFTFSIVMDTCIDGQSGSGLVTSKYGVKGKGKVKGDGVELEVEIDIQGSAKDVVEEEKK
jgi:hypothetical protein